jgi:hypothetical protein
MRSLFCLVAMLGWLVLSGCASERAKSLPSPPSDAAGVRTNTAGDPAPKLIVTPETGLNGKVALVNLNLRFVVLNFPVGQMPMAGQRLNVYRRGLKVGEVKVNGMPLEDNTVADIVAGEAEVGDTARDK